MRKKYLSTVEYNIQTNHAVTRNHELYDLSIPYTRRILTMEDAVLHIFIAICYHKINLEAL